MTHQWGLMQIKKSSWIPTNNKITIGGMITFRRCLKTIKICKGWTSGQHNYRIIMAKWGHPSKTILEQSTPRLLAIGSRSPTSGLSSIREVWQPSSATKGALRHLSWTEYLLSRAQSRVRWWNLVICEEFRMILKMYPRLLLNQARPSHPYLYKRKSL